MKDKTVADSNIGKVYVVDFESPHDFVEADKLCSCEV